MVFRYGKAGDGAGLGEKIKNSSGNMLNSIRFLDTQVEVPSKQFSMSSYQFPEDTHTEGVNLGVIRPWGC